MTQKKNRPAGTGRLTTTTTTAASIASAAVIRQRRPRSAAVCRRCGVPFAWTDLAALRRCAELTREAS